MPPVNNSRRNFIKIAVLTTAGFYIVPRHVLGRGYIAPSDKLNIAGIGAGGKADVNLPYAWNKGGENIDMRLLLYLRTLEHFLYLGFLEVK